MRSLILGLLLSLGATTLAADKEEPPFDFERTLAIVIPTQDGYFIRQRPTSPADYAGNFERQGFVSLYRTLEPYLYLLQLQEKPQPPANGAIQWQLIFVNPGERQYYFIGDHWIGDGRHRVAMEDADYRRLLSQFDGRRTPNRGSPEGYMERLQKKFTLEEVSPFPEYAGDVPAPEAASGQNEAIQLLKTLTSQTSLRQDSNRALTAPTDGIERAANPTVDEAAPERTATDSPPINERLPIRTSELLERTQTDGRQDGSSALWRWLLAIVAAAAFGLVRAVQVRRISQQPGRHPG